MKNRGMPPTKHTTASLLGDEHRVCQDSLPFRKKILNNINQEKKS